MTIESLGFHHLAVQVLDVERVAAFYRDVVGLSEVKRFVRDDGSLRSVWLAATAGDLSRGFLAVEHQPGGVALRQPALGFSMIAFRIDPARRAAVVESLRAHGVSIVKETGWTLYVADPEGNLVGLSHHPFDAPA